MQRSVTAYGMELKMINALTTDKMWNIGYVSGTFDLFHIGHLNLLKNAKSRCNHLIVGVLSDECVYRNKRKYPVIPICDRLEIVKAIKYTDEADITTVELLSKEKAWEKYHFDAMFTGDDHAADTWAWDEPQVNAHGAELVYFPYTQKISTSQLRKELNK